MDGGIVSKSGESGAVSAEESSGSEKNVNLIVLRAIGLSSACKLVPWGNVHECNVMTLKE